MNRSLRGTHLSRYGSLVSASYARRWPVVGLPGISPARARGETASRLFGEDP
jgi:hypothetical protein